MRVRHGDAHGSASVLARERAGGLWPALLVGSLAVVAAACATDPAARPAATKGARTGASERISPELVGIYASRLPLATGDGRVVTLELMPDASALLTSVHADGGVERRPGRWSASSGAVALALEPEGPAGVAPAQMRWTHADAQLVPLAWDEGAWGAEGLPLARWSASREPGEGCSWQPVVDAQLGVRLLVQHCPQAPLTVLVDEGRLLLLADGDPIEFASPVLEVFEKPPAEPLDQAIRKRFVPRLMRRARKDCTVVPSPKADLADPAKQAWELVPTDAYRADTEHWRSQEPAARVCGPYGEQAQVSYFEYHPAESRTRYLFVRLDPDAILDERSIQLLR